MQLHHAVRARGGCVHVRLGHSLVRHAQSEELERLGGRRHLVLGEVLHEELAAGRPAQPQPALGPARWAAVGGQRGGEEVVDLLLVELEVAHPHAHVRARPTRRGRAREELVDCARNETELGRVRLQVGHRPVGAVALVLETLHREGLATRRLAVGEDRRVVAGDRRRNQLAHAANRIDISLVARRVRHTVEAEACLARRARRAHADGTGGAIDAQRRRHAARLAR
mmetsp:Transcript_8097/g.19060  ORF Transcript_8097/g.19060 Transcript_8097/m.19060 type:complete len:226 (-) Transcript_8097:112-789(-)